MKNPQSYTSKGTMVYQYESDSGTTTRLVQQPDGSFWKYHYYNGRSLGTPQRSKKLQGYFQEIISKIVAELN